MESVVNQGHECSFEPCSKPARYKKLCNAHYTQRCRGKELTLLVPRKTRYGSVCSFRGCPLQHYSKGYCKAHARQLKKGGALKALHRRNLWENGEKVCPGCGVKKPESEYDRNSSKRSKFHERCKPCRKLYRSRYQKMNKTKKKAQSKS